MSNSDTHRDKPRQPLDRHLSEIDQSDRSHYINAGIDSTCCNKRTETLYKLTDGVVTSITTPNEQDSPTPTNRFANAVRQLMERPVENNNKTIVD